jgi:glycosyltransferase involved in cell wall biosynthesis
LFICGELSSRFDARGFRCGVMDESVKCTDRSRPRVCLLADSYHPVVGGGEVHARLIARVWRERGHDLFVLTQHRVAESVKHDTLDGVEVVRVGRAGHKRWGKYLMMPAAARALWRRRRDYDMIYCCGLRVLGVLAVLCGKAMGKRVMLRSESCTELSGEHVLEHLDRRPKRWLRPLVRATLGLRNAVLKRADAFMAISREIAQEYRECGVPKRKVHVIHNGIELDRFRPADAQEQSALRQRLGLPLGGVLVTYTGKLNRGKGLESLMRAWKAVAAKHADAHLVLVGSGRMMYLSCERELREYVGANGLASRVAFTGYQTDVPDYLRASDVFVLASESEGLPISLIEAMACGLGCVATGVGGMLDVATRDVNALLVPVMDDAALAAALDRMIGDRSLRARLGTAALERAQAFEIGTIVEQHEALFSAVCG